MDFACVRPLKAAPEALDRRGDAVDIPHRMKLPLPREAQCGTEVIRLRGDVLRPAHLHARPARRFHFAPGHIGRLPRRHDEIALYALEVAIDAFAADDLFDGVDRGRVAAGRELGAPVAV